MLSLPTSYNKLITHVNVNAYRYWVSSLTPEAAHNATLRIDHFKKVKPIWPTFIFTVRFLVFTK